MKIHLLLDDDFNQKIEKNTLPEGVESITFGYYFNQKIERGDLPEGVESLTFGGLFNQEIERNTLPDGLKSLTFGSHFNQKIEEGILPEGVESLAFGDRFNQKIDEGVLPNSIKTLKFSRNYKESISFPLNLQKLTCNLTTLTHFSNDERFHLFQEIVLVEDVSLLLREKKGEVSGEVSEESYLYILLRSVILEYTLKKFRESLNALAF